MFKESGFSLFRVVIVKEKINWNENKKKKIPSATGSPQFALAKHDQDTDTMHKNQGHKEETHKKPSGGLGANHG